MTAGAHAVELRERARVQTEQATYQLIRERGSGSFGRTWEASVVTRRVGATDPYLRVRRGVILKFAKIDPSAYSYPECQERLAKVTASLHAEYAAASRLRHLRSVAHVVDIGNVWLPFNERYGALQAPYLVYEPVNGVLLNDYIARLPHSASQGVPDERTFFDLATQLASAVRDIHERNVIHGDIWPENVMVRNDGTVCLIDFGQAFFRELVDRRARPATVGHAYQAPELRRKEVHGEAAADLYSLGATLYYTATGHTPPMKWPASVKRSVTQLLEKHNPQLYAANCGIADVIARCVRPQHERARTAQAVLQDIALFAPPDIDPADAGRCRDVQTAATLAEYGAAVVREQIKDPTFQVMAEMKLRRLDDDLSDMAHGVYDISGDREELVASLSQYLSLLGREPGDEYLTLSTVDFWLPHNIGTNGRFLSVNRRAAERGAAIRRVFLVPTDEDASRVRRVLDAHRAVLRQLKGQGCNTSDKTVSAGGYWAGVVSVSRADLLDIDRERSHCGRIIRHDTETWVTPVYRHLRVRGDDGKEKQRHELVSLRFRSADAQMSALQRRFDQFLDRAVSLIGD